MTELLVGAVAGAVVAGGAAYMMNKNGQDSGSGNAAETEMLKREIARLKEQAKKDEELITSLQNRAKEYSQTQKKTDDELDDLEDELDKTKKRLRELETQNKEYEERIADYKSEVAQYKVELEKYKN
ncbi:MAG: hypothetical protein IKQ61_05745 [Spirochaetales bacterium]|nr:hypothetical protein [Spirochaetales bacterium]